MKTDNDLREILSEAIIKEGSLRKWANKNGISPSAVSKALNEVDKPFYPAIAKLLGYKRATRVWVTKQK